MRLSECGDREIEILMRESIKRMFSNAPLSREDMTHIYDEYRKRELTAPRWPIKESARVHGAPSNVCGCKFPLDDHEFKRGKARCQEAA